MMIYKAAATKQFQPISLIFKLQSLSEVKAMFALFSQESNMSLIGRDNAELVKSLIHADKEGLTTI